MSTTASTAAPPPPPPHRRPRVREVSSRFMSPLIPSTPSDPQTRSKSAQRRREDHDIRSSQNEDGNLQDMIRRSLDTPKSVLVSSINRKHVPKSRQKLFKENGDPQKIGTQRDDFQQKGLQSSVRSSISRSDTPNLIGTDRVVPSRYKQPNQLQRSFTVSAATRLLQEATSDDDMAGFDSKLKRIVTVAGEEENQQPRSCPNSPICKSRAVPERSCGSPKMIAAPSPCYRSLDFRGSNGDCNSSSSGLGCWVPSSRVALKMGVLPLPPHPKLGSLDSRRGKKGGKEEDVHSLRLMHNHLLQWRLANAKAEASMQAQKTEAERQLYSLGSHIAGLRDAVEIKRRELAKLQRMTTLSTILQGHMPNLDKWSDFEEDYSASLSGMTNALLNASLRLPIGGEVRQVDVAELGEVLDSASKAMEMVGSHIQSFMPKAAETDALSSELARVASGEKALVEECGSLALKMNASQVNEWSLRSHMIQVKGTRTTCFE